MELLGRHPLQCLVDGLAARDRVVYRENGNRSVAAREMLRRVEPLLPAVGITRVADISQLIPFSYPVFQTLRPNLHFHSSLGQNTGSQGKGPTAEQARLSAIMESIEAFSAEPRHPAPLIRGSFAFLRGQHVVFDPRRLHCVAPEPPRRDEPFMWTEAFELETKQQVLVPAESIFFPFLPADYETRGCFPCGTNGLASGGTYLDAVLHAIYEVVERHYLALHDLGRLDVERFHLSGIIDLRDFATRASDLGINLYALKIPGVRNLPMIMCLLEDRERQHSFAGYGCCASVDVAVSRAISEAWQSLATASSGSREDIARVRAPAVPGAAGPTLPAARTLRVDDYRRTVVDRDFSSLGDEYASVRAWLAEHGLGTVLVSNLTRRGIDIPVVKVLIPSVQRRARSSAGAVTSADIVRQRHGRGA